MRTGRIWLLGLLAVASPAMAQDDAGLDARRVAVDQLFQARDEDKKLTALAHWAANIYVQRFKQSHPDLPQERLDALITTIQANLLASRDDYLKPEKDLLSRRLTLDDLQAAIAFYRTPAGKRLAAISPDLIPDIARVQSAWVNAAIVKATNEVNAKAVK